MHEYNLLELETADCDMNFGISRAESSPGIFQDQQHLFIYLLFDAEHGFRSFPCASCFAKKG